jgi:hypothetical protein
MNTLRLSPAESRFRIAVAAAVFLLGFLPSGPTGAQDTTRPRPADTTRARPSDSSRSRVADTSRARTADTTARADSSKDSTSLAGKPLSPKKGGKRTSKTSTRAAGATTRATKPEPVWPVKGPDPLPGSLLPENRIVAFYGNPLSKRMGVLGELPPDDMLAKLDREAKAWSAADPSTPVKKALHLIAVTAQGSSGRDGKYRLRMDSTLIEKVYGWAQKHDAILFLDVQVAQSTLQEELPKLARFLKRPDVHLGIDPEFSMHYSSSGKVPGTKIGTFKAADVNYAASFLADLVAAEKLPPKILVVHRFTRSMLPNAEEIKLDPRVQVVIDMDGWGPPQLKRDSYHDYVYQHPVQFTGFKLFYHNDTKKGHALMTPADVLALFPKPLYIQYQ